MLAAVDHTSWTRQRSVAHIAHVLQCPAAAGIQQQEEAGRASA